MRLGSGGAGPGSSSSPLSREISFVLVGGAAGPAEGLVVVGGRCGAKCPMFLPSSPSNVAEFLLLCRRLVFFEAAGGGVGAVEGGRDGPIDGRVVGPGAEGP